MTGQKKVGRPRKTTANTNLKGVKMNGIYTGATEDSFKSSEQIRKSKEPVFSTPRQEINKPFSYWSPRLKERQKTVLETLQKPQTAEIQLFGRSLISFQADQHIGGAYTDYARIEKEAEAIVNTPNSYTFLLGDLCDCFAFNPAQFEDIEQIQEQLEYAKSLVKYYADNKKLLGVWTGNHDQWVKKAGFDPYRYILEGIDTYYFHGVGYVKTSVDEQDYKITGNHMFKGNSGYNNSHPQRRAMNEVAFGSDIVVSGHWHTKGINQQPFRGFGGESYVTTMIALGTYKATDEYVRTYGMSNQDANSMFGASVILEADRHLVLPHYDIMEAHQEF